MHLKADPPGGRKIMRNRAIYLIGALSILLMICICALILWISGSISDRAPETFSNARLVWVGEAMDNGRRI